MKKSKFFLPLFFISFISAKTPWARTYKHVFTQDQMARNRKKSEIVTRNHDVLPFTQLVFSWNAKRPLSGKFEFYARVRDAKTKTWDKWHKIVEWGADIQKSHFSRGQHSVHHYARLEMNSGRKGDAFQLKAKTHGRASVGAVQALMATVSDFTRFTSEPYKDRGKGLVSYTVKNVDKKSQMVLEHPRANVLCSPTSMSMVTQFLSEQEVEPTEFAQYAYDSGLDAFGNWGFNMAHAYEHLRGDMLFYTTRLSSFKDLHDLIIQDIPVAVSVRGSMAGAPQAYNKGHLLVVVGWDAENQSVLCHDPAFHEVENVLQAYNIHDFIVAWERSRRLTYRPEVAL